MVITWKINLWKVNRTQFKIENFPNNFMRDVSLLLHIAFISMVMIIYALYSEISTRILAHSPAFPILVELFCKWNCPNKQKKKLTLKVFIIL
jgi:hypothetical protein